MGCKPPDFQGTRNRCSTPLTTDTFLRKDKSMKDEVNRMCEHTNNMSTRKMRKERWVWSEARKTGQSTETQRFFFVLLFCIVFYNAHNSIIYGLEELMSCDPMWLSFSFHLSHYCIAISYSCIPMSIIISHSGSVSTSSCTEQWSGRCVNENHSL